MSIESDKLLLIEWIAGETNEKLIGKLVNFKNSMETDWWDELTLDAQKNALKGLDQLNKGEGISHHDAMNKIKEKFKI